MARVFTFVHAADIHLDTPYRRHDDATRARLQEAGRQAFTRLIDLAIEVDADALLIAGDLFDNDRLMPATERLVVEELTRLSAAGTTVVYATGNHDPGRANYRAMKIDWPAKPFHLVAARRPVTIKIKRRGEVVAQVVAAGHQTARESENLAAGFPPAPGPEPAVALLHAQVEGAQGAPDDEAKNTYAPARRGDLDKGYAYWALGHVHRRQPVSDDPPARYPGNLQGRDFGETGAKGALVVTMQAGAAPSFEFRPLAPVRWDLLALNDLAQVESAGEIAQRVATAFRALRAAPDVLSDQEWLLRVDLSGPCPLARVLRDADAQAELAELLRDDLGVLDVDLRVRDLHPPFDIDAHRGQAHLLGQTLELLVAAETDDAALDSITPTELAGVDRADADARRRYLRDLLHRLDTVAAEALLREPTP